MRQIGVCILMVLLFISAAVAENTSFTKQTDDEFQQFMGNQPKPAVTKPQSPAPAQKPQSEPVAEVEEERELIAGDAESYRYLAESIRMHPDQETLKGMMENAGFERCDVHNLTGGIVAVHSGTRP